MKLRNLLKNKKGMTLGDIYPAVLTLVLVGIILGIGIYVLAEISSNITNPSAAAAVNTTITGIGNFASWIAIIVVVIAAAVVLGVVLSSFGGGQRI